MWQQAKHKHRNMYRRKSKKTDSEKEKITSWKDGETKKPKQQKHTDLMSSNPQDSKSLPRFSHLLLLPLPLSKESEDSKFSSMFCTSGAELMDVVDTLQCDVSIIQKEMAKNLAFLPKMFDKNNTNSIVEALSAVIDAAIYSVHRQKLEARVQNQHTSDEDDGGMSTQVAATCQSRSSDIVNVLTDSLDKAQVGPDDTRIVVTTAA